jgi:hypothetical protein
VARSDVPHNLRVPKSPTRLRIRLKMALTLGARGNFIKLSTSGGVFLKLNTGLRFFGTVLNENHVDVHPNWMQTLLISGERLNFRGGVD